MDIVWFERQIFEKNFSREEKEEKLIRILKRNGYEQETYTVYWVDYADAGNDTDAVRGFIELYLRAKLKNESIVIFNNSLSINIDAKQSVRFTEELNKLKNVAEVFFADVSYQPFHEIKDELKKMLKMKIGAHSGIRRNLNELLSNSIRQAEEINHDMREYRTLGHSEEELEKYERDCQYVSMASMAEFLQISRRSLSAILKPENNQNKAKLKLSKEQQALLEEALNKDYEVATSRLQVRITKKKIKLN